jgi:hypothetical protein
MIKQLRLVEQAGPCIAASHAPQGHPDTFAWQQSQLPWACVGLPANLIVGGRSEVLENQFAPRFQTQLR